MFQSKKIASIASVAALVSLLSISAFAADKAQEQPMEQLQMAMTVIPATEISTEATPGQSGEMKVMMTKIQLPEEISVPQESIPATALTPAMQVK